MTVPEDLAAPLPEEWQWAKTEECHRNKTMNEVKQYNHRIVMSWMDSNTAFLIYL